MRFNDHYQQEGRHAYLSPSQHAWTNYDDEKLERRYLTSLAARRGTALHALAHELITLGVKLPDVKKALNQYVNDAIGYRMQSEVCLYYSDHCFGHVDTIKFEANKLRIHDLKTGVSATSIRQLEVYAALFCLEYHFKPFDIEIELRIYKGSEVDIFTADPDVIYHLMDTIINSDRILSAIEEEALS